MSLYLIGKYNSDVIDRKHISCPPHSTTKQVENLKNERFGIELNLGNKTFLGKAIHFVVHGHQDQEKENYQRIRSDKIRATYIVISDI